MSVVTQPIVHQVIVGEGLQAVVIVRRQDVVKVVSVVEQGPPGPPGPPGSGGGLTVSQPTPSAQWTINHNLGYKPAVDLFDVGGNEFDAEVLHLSNNTLQVNLLVPLAGFARLN